MARLGRMLHMNRVFCATDVEATASIDAAVDAIEAAEVTKL